MIKKSDDLSITNISLIEGILQMMKRDPSYLLDFLETSEPASLFNFMNELPSFYFDYTEIKDYANFLELFFSRKYEKGGFVDYKKNIVFTLMIRTFETCTTVSFGNQIAFPSRRELLKSWFRISRNFKLWRKTSKPTRKP